MAKFPTYKQMVKEVAEKALDEYLINGKTLREWVKIIAEQEPKTDTRECGSCKYSKDGRMAGTEECHECMWESKYEPKTDTWSIKDIAKALEKHGFGRLEQEPKADYKAFAEWVAGEIFSAEWEFNKDSFAGVACRKLEKLGLIKADGGEWVMPKYCDRNICIRNEHNGIGCDECEVTKAESEASK